MHKITIHKSALRLTELMAGLTTLRLDLSEAIEVIHKLGFRDHEDNGLATWHAELAVPLNPLGRTFPLPFTLNVDRWGTCTATIHQTNLHHLARFLVELREEFPIVATPMRRRA